MNPAERLKEIEDQGQGTISDETWDEFKWLISRVKRLTGIIKTRCACYESKNPTYAVKCRLCQLVEEDQ